MTNVRHPTPLHIAVIGTIFCTVCTFGCSSVVHYAANSTQKKYVQQKEKDKADKARREALLNAARKVAESNDRIDKVNKNRKDKYSDIELIDVATMISIADLQSRINIQSYAHSVMSNVHVRVVDIIRSPNGKDGERNYSALVEITNLNPGAIRKLNALVTGVPLDGQSTMWSGYVRAGNGKNSFVGAHTTKKVLLPLTDPNDGVKSRFEIIGSKKGWQVAPFPSMDNVRVVSTVMKIYDSIIDERLESVSKSHSSDVDNFLLLKKYKN